MCVCVYVNVMCVCAFSTENFAEETACVYVNVMCVCTCSTENLAEKLHVCISAREYSASVCLMCIYAQNQVNLV